MAERTRGAVDSWDLNEIIAAVRQIARDTGADDAAEDTEAEAVRRINSALSTGDPQ